MKLMDVLSNPVRMRVAQYLQINGEATTKVISEALPDIPAPTLYRHINQMLSEGVLKVTTEKKIRGTVERTIALDERFWDFKDNGDFADIAYQFLMSLYFRFQEYCSDGENDPVADRLSLRTFTLRLSDEKFDNFFADYKQLIDRYQASEDGGKLRSISFISAPMKEEIQ
jgi:hypothetical protein